MAPTYAHSLERVALTAEPVDEDGMGMVRMRYTGPAGTIGLLDRFRGTDRTLRHQVAFEAPRIVQIRIENFGEARWACELYALVDLASVSYSPHGFEQDGRLARTSYRVKIAHFYGSFLLGETDLASASRILSHRLFGERRRSAEEAAIADLLEARPG